MRFSSAIKMVALSREQQQSELLAAAPFEFLHNMSDSLSRWSGHWRGDVEEILFTAASRLSGLKYCKRKHPGEPLIQGQLALWALFAVPTLWRNCSIDKAALPHTVPKT
ncbi:hypothetical protein NQZ68_010739 [Dissostichus eleginoides]|nr:hypothetical protein NQZ68_010739 [Dissostichus eleginoides]